MNKLTWLMPLLFVGALITCGDSTEEGADCDPDSFEEFCDATEKIRCRDDGTVDHYGCCLSCRGTACGCNETSDGASCFCN